MECFRAQGFNGLGRRDESFAGQALALKLVHDAAVVDRFGVCGLVSRVRASRLVLRGLWTEPFEV